MRRLSLFTVRPALTLTAVATALVGAPLHAAPVRSARSSSTPKPVAVEVPKASIERAKTHKFRPAVAGRIVESEKPELHPFKVPKFKFTPKLDTAKFADAMHEALVGSARGYALQLRRNGVPEITLTWEWSRSPEDGGKGFTLDSRMHVASVSKLITAIVITDLLDEKGLDVDTKIGPYLPSYWTVGNNVADITFRDLLTHRSGFSTGGSDGSFPVMKSEVAGAVSTSPDGDYENVNFSLCRVLGAVLAGAIDKDTVFPLANDAMWDIITTDWFLARAQSHVFDPAGVANVSPKPKPSGALAYASKTDAKGWQSGDVTTQLGGVGFRLSVNEVLSVLHHFRRAETIVTKAKAKAAIEARLGIDQATETPAGTIYNKNGGWGDGDGNTEQSVAFFMPENIEVVVFVNSPITANEGSLRNTVRNAYLASLK